MENINELYIFHSFNEFSDYIGDEWLNIIANHKDKERSIQDLEYLKIVYFYGEPLIFLKRYGNEFNIIMFLMVEIEIKNIYNTSPNFYFDYKEYTYNGKNTGKYKALKLINCIYKQSNNFINTVLDYIATYIRADIITIYTYNNLSNEFISLKWNNVANKVCDLYNGEIGNIPSDSLSIVLPDNLDLLLNKFNNNEKHLYNCKRLQREIRRINKNFCSSGSLQTTM